MLQIKRLQAITPISYLRVTFVAVVGSTTGDEVLRVEALVLTLRNEDDEDDALVVVTVVLGLSVNDNVVEVLLVSVVEDDDADGVVDGDVGSRQVINCDLFEDEMKP